MHSGSSTQSSTEAGTLNSPRSKIISLTHVLSNISKVRPSSRSSVHILQAVKSSRRGLTHGGCVCVCVSEGSVLAAVLGWKVAPCHFYSACGRLCVRTMLMADIRRRERVQQSQRLHSEKGGKKPVCCHTVGPV